MIDHIVLEPAGVLYSPVTFSRAYKFRMMWKGQFMVGFFSTDGDRVHNVTYTTEHPDDDRTTEEIESTLAITDADLVTLVGQYDVDSIDPLDDFAYNHTTANYRRN